jgi:hypothetical protein
MRSWRRGHHLWTLQTMHIEDEPGPGSDDWTFHAIRP